MLAGYLKYRKSNLVIKNQVKGVQLLTMYGELIVSSFIGISSSSALQTPRSPFLLVLTSWQPTLSQRIQPYVLPPQYSSFSIFSNMVFVETLPFIPGLRKCEIQIALLNSHAALKFCLCWICLSLQFSWQTTWLGLCLVGN